MTKTWSLSLLWTLLGCVISIKLLTTMWLHNASRGSLIGEDVIQGWRVPKLLPLSTPLRPVRTHLSDTVHYQMTGDDEEWARLIPGDGTFVYQDQHTNQEERLTVSIYHQLRCLDILRRNIVLVEQLKHNNPSYHGVTPYTQHCINYLREMALCRGDLDLETVVGQPKSGVILNQYQCWDWEAVYNFVSDNRNEDHSK